LPSRYVSKKARISHELGAVSSPSPLCLDFDFDRVTDYLLARPHEVADRD
jgi:hypothetical protein